MERIEQKLESQVNRVMVAAMRAPEVAAGQIPEGMSATELQIARDAMISEREAPSYLRMANRMVDTYKRARVLSERDPAPRLNVETIQVVVNQPQFNYEVIEDPASKR